jgi:predicted nucleic acid-binding protein
VTVLVVDASVIVDLVLNMPPHAARIRQRLRVPGTTLAAPHLLDAEVGNVLRNRVLRGHLGTSEAGAAIEDLLGLPIDRYPHSSLLLRAFRLRDNATMYDALYLSLAEALGASFLTRDGALASIPGVDVRVEVIADG